MEHPNCEKCKRINVVKEAADRLFDQVVQRARSFVTDVRRRNNLRWVIFADDCKRTFLGLKTGERLFQKQGIPKNLEKEPDYSEEEWYRLAKASLSDVITEIERLKNSHLKHWGDEVVDVRVAGDEGGYYVPAGTCAKRRAVAKINKSNPRFKVGIGSPREYFITDAVDRDRMVLCAETRQIASIANCGMLCVSGQPPRYYSGRALAERVEVSEKALKQMNESDDPDTELMRQSGYPEAEVNYIKEC